MELEQAWDWPSQEEESLNLAWLTIQDASTEPTGALPMEATSGPSSAAGPQEPSSSSTSRKRKINEVEETPEEGQRRERREQNRGYKQASRERQWNPVHYLPTNEHEQMACLRSRIFQLELQLGFRSHAGGAAAQDRGRGPPPLRASSGTPTSHPSGSDRLKGSPSLFGMLDPRLVPSPSVAFRHAHLSPEFRLSARTHTRTDTHTPTQIPPTSSHSTLLLRIKPPTLCLLQNGRKDTPFFGGHWMDFSFATILIA